MKVALVTGGARGIGLGIARELAATGWALMLNGVRPAAEVATAVAELRELGADVDYCPGDLAEASQRQRLIDVIRERFGRLDALVNNAGITSPGRVDILDAEESSFDRVMGVNLKGPYFLTQAAARLMNETQPPHGQRRSVVFVSSVSGERPSVNRGDYCLSKAALGMATQLWAARLAEFGIDVYEVRPGVIHSDMTAGVQAKYDTLIAQGLTLDRRWGETRDVGKAVAALLNGHIPYATGQVLRIDGGMTIQPL